MPYIDKNKIDLRLPYLKDEDDDALVSVRAIEYILALAIAPGVASVEEVVSKLVEKLIRFTENVSKYSSDKSVESYSIIREDYIYQAAKEVLEDYYGKKDTEEYA